MRKTEVEGFYKTTEGFLVNKDNEGLQQYKLNKRKEMRINIMEDKLKSIESNLDEIKEILKGLVK